jgi:hypothetical protein
VRCWGVLAKLKKKKGLEAYVVTAIPVAPSRVQIAFNVVDADDDFIASAVVAVDVTDGVSSTLVYEADRYLVDYVVDAEGWQCLLLADRVVEIGGKPGSKPVETKTVPEGMYRMSALGGEQVAICGDSGQVYTFAKRRFTKVPTDTGAKNPKYQEDLKSIHFATPTRGYVVGSYGTFLKGTTKKLEPAWRDTNPFGYFEDGTTKERRTPVLAVYETSSGAVLLGSDEGPAVIFEAGTFTKLTGLARDAKVFAMIEFKGIEYWSTDSNSLYTRKGTKLRKRPEKAGGYRMEANAALMASSAGSFVYLFDGKAWTRLQVHPDPKRLVERVKLDF